MTDLLKKLAEPTEYWWRLQSAKNGRATLVAYIDARQVQEVLDSVVRPENWQSDFKIVGGELFGGIGIKINQEWIWKWDVGVESNVDKEKGRVSDAYKRAAVHWGIGRFLYSLGTITLRTKMHSNNKEYPCTIEGDILWGKEDVDAYAKRLHEAGILDATKHTSSPGGSTPQESGDVVAELPWISTKQVEAAIKRIESGEPGVIDNVVSKFRVSKANMQKLTAAKEIPNSPGPAVVPADDSTPDYEHQRKAKVKAKEVFEKYEAPEKWVSVKAYGKKVLDKESGTKAFKAGNAAELVDVLSIDELQTLYAAVRDSGL